MLIRAAMTLALSCLLGGISCMAPERKAETDAGTVTETQAAPELRDKPVVASKPDVKSQEIYIDSVVVANPMMIRGRARTFENTVSVRLRDAQGGMITERHTTSVGEMGHHNPFEIQLWVTRNPGQRVTVDAFEYSAKDGSVRSLVSKTVGYDVEPIAATLMFPTADCTSVKAFTRRLPKSVAMARLLTEALVAGPDSGERAAGATAPFPRGSEIRSVILRQGELTVDFNERLQNVGGSCAALGIRQSVTQTLTHLPGVSRVTITAAGSRELALQP